MEENVLLSQFSTFGIGGPARWLVRASTVDELKEALHFAISRQLPYITIGKGSNCLFDDEGYDGLVIINRHSTVECSEEGFVTASSGFSFARLGSYTARRNLSGLEFAAGIPGTVGGAVFMNAGANGSDTSERLVYVDFLHESGEVKRLLKRNLLFSYRHSPFQSMPGIILEAGFQLEPCPVASQKQHEILHYRTSTQPYGEKSAGCIFRNPDIISAGALIDKLGLKGMSVGDAEISTQHANFIVNKGNAKAQDVLELIRLIQERVHATHDIELMQEVCFIPKCSSIGKECVSKE